MSTRSTRELPPYKKKKTYVMTKLETDVHANLLRLQALRVLETGKKVNLSDIVREMVSSQPTFEITAREVKPNS
jgi:hypothetical protein